MKIKTSTGRRTFLKTIMAGAGGMALGWPSASLGHPTRLTSPYRSDMDSLHAASQEDVRLTGVFGRHIDRCIEHRIAVQPLRELVAPFRHREETWCWSGEFWGKWFLSAADAYRYTGDAELEQLLKDAIYELLATQDEDGYIGVYSDDNRLSNWDVWSRKYTMLGLLAFYDLTGDRAVLDSTRHLADHLIADVGPGGEEIVRTGLYRGMASSSVLVPVVQLFERTGDEKYLAFAQHIVDSWSAEDGPRLVEHALAGVPVADRFPPPEDWWSWENGAKAYEMMSCYEGLINLYRVTGEESYRMAVLRSWENIRDTEINIVGSGASMECWYGGRARQTEPIRHPMETCVTTTWMGLCANLLRLTGDPLFADELERTAYNALLASLTPDGTSFAKYSPLQGVRQLGEKQCGTDLNCCVANGPRGLMLLPSVAVMASAQGPVVNLYESGEATVPLSRGESATIVQETHYPKSETARLTVNPSAESAFTLRLRVPRWSLRTRIAVNGEDQGPVEPGRYHPIERRWSRGDTVELALDLRGHAVFSPGPQHVHAAVVRGPLVLARDQRLCSASVDDPLTPVTDSDGMMELQPVDDRPDGVWLSFRASFENGPHDRKGKLALCDYRSAGNTWSESSRMRVWIPQRVDPSAEMSRSAG